MLTVLGDDLAVKVESQYGVTAEKTTMWLNSVLRWNWCV